MDRNFFISGLCFQIRQSLKKLPFLLGMTAVLLSLSMIAGSVAVMLLSNRRYSRVTLAVASEDADPRLADLVRSLNGNPEVNEFLVIHEGQPSQMEGLIESGSAEGALVLPAGFFDKPTQSASPRLIIRSSRQLETVILDKMADSSIRMFAAFRQGVGRSEEIIREKVEDPARAKELARGMAEHYVRWLLGYKQMLRRVTVNSTGFLSISQHYMLSALLFFFFLTMPLYYRDLSIRNEQGWAARLRSAGVRLPSYAAVRVLGISAVLTGPLIASLLGLRLLDGTKAAPLFFQSMAGLILSMLLTVLISFLCSNAGGIVHAITLNTAVASVFLIFSGGIVPPLLLSPSVRTLLPFSPFTWMRDCLSGLYGVSANTQSLLRLTISVVMLAVWSAFRADRMEKKGMV